MNRVAGLMTSEIVTIIIGVVVCAGAAFGWYVNAERDAAVADALASLAAFERQLSAQATPEQGEGALLRCDDSLLAPGVLANPFIPLSVRPTPVEDANLKAGFGPGLYIEGEREEDGDDHFVSVERLYEALKESKEDRLRWVTKEDDEIQFSVLASQSVLCKNLEVEAGAPD